MNAINELKNFMINVQKGYDNSANNLANVTSGGFKKHLNIERNRSMLNYVDTAHGDYVPTNNPSQAALKGDAYFVIDTPTGELYTRNGDFKINENNELVTLDDNPVLGNNGIIRLRRLEQLTIDQDGVVYSGDAKIDTLRLVRPENPNRVETAGNCFLTFQAEPVAPKGMVMPETLGNFQKT